MQQLGFVVDLGKLKLDVCVKLLFDFVLAYAIICKERGIELVVTFNSSAKIVSKMDRGKKTTQFV